MLAYDGSHILHTAIAYFDVVLVEKGVILVLSREMFRYDTDNNNNNNNNNNDNNNNNNDNNNTR